MSSVLGPGNDVQRLVIGHGEDERRLTIGLAIAGTMSNQIKNIALHRPSLVC